MPDYEAAIKSKGYFAYPFDADCTETPGGDLAEDLAKELREHGYESVEVSNEGLIWVVGVATESRSIDIVVSLYEPDERPQKAVWNISVPTGRGFFDRLFSRPEKRHVLSLLDSVHKSLLTMGNEISDIRWLREWPAEPFDTDKKFERKPPRA